MIRAYAEQAGLSGTAQAMQTSLDEAKATEERHNEIAANIMRGYSRATSRVTIRKALRSYAMMRLSYCSSGVASVRKRKVGVTISGLVV